MKTNIKQSVIALMLSSVMAMPMALAAGEPENVENVTLTPKDATTLTVKWDEAKDKEGNAVDHYRIYYGTASVQKAEAANYETEVNTPDNKTTYDLTGLSKDKTYYVSITALDKDDVESLEYSVEVSGKTSGEAQQSNANSNANANANATDKVAPTVINAVAADKNHVLVGFSEKVTLPATLPEAAFSITEQINVNNVLEVKSAKLYADDPAGKTVLLETANQTKNVNYIMTVGVAVTDAAGNAIQSGNTDSALFLGSDLANSIVAGNKPAETTPPVTTPPTTTDTKTPAADDLLTQTPTVEADKKAPEDVTNLTLTLKKQLESFMVMMNWTPSLNTAKDLVDQIVYQSMDNGVTYGTGKSLGATGTSHEVSGLTPGEEYTFKVTTKDSAGNESVGAVKSIRLPQTGIGAGLLLLGSAAVANRILRKKK